MKDGCAHKSHEDCLVCTGCGECREDLDEADLCGECRGEESQPEARRPCVTLRT